MKGGESGNRKLLDDAIPPELKTTPVALSDKNRRSCNIATQTPGLGVTTAVSTTFQKLSHGLEMLQMRKQ